jgi:hypothetical protein
MGVREDQVRIGTQVRCPRGHEHTYRASDNLSGRLYCTAGDCWSDGCQSDDGGGTHYDRDKLELIEAAHAPAEDAAAVTEDEASWSDVWEVEDAWNARPVGHAPSDYEISAIRLARMVRAKLRPRDR